MFLIYSAILAVALLLSSPFWLVQMIRLGKYRAGLRERLGFVPRRVQRNSSGPVVWIHAVSVGEVLAIGTLVQELRANIPASRVVVSTTTHTGQKLARERFGEENVFYFPLDLPFCIAPYLRKLRPSLVVLAETEFWPNFIRMTSESGARLAVVNARISDRSYPRYKRFRGLLARVLRYVDLFLAQSEVDAQRLCEIGAPSERVRVSGNLKFDVAPPKEVALVEELRAEIAASDAGPVIVAGSTVEDEEEMVLTAFRAVLQGHPRAVLLLAPRHKERFEDVAQMLSESELPWRQRTLFETGEHALGGAILLLDSIGELASIYALGDVAFVGGSLVACGGHNILEPAHYGVPILIGPHTENFRDIVELFAQANARIVVLPETLGEITLALLAREEERKALGERGRQVLATQRGATARTIESLQGLLTRTKQ